MEKTVQCCIVNRKSSPIIIFSLKITFRLKRKKKKARKRNRKRHDDINTID